MEQKRINPWQWQDQFAFSQAIEVTGGSRVVYCAGQTSVDANGTPLNVGDMPAQINLALDNLETVLGAAGMTLANVVRLNYYTTDMTAFGAASLGLTARLQGAGVQPAGTLLGVTALAFPGLLVEIEATAVA
jgi:enamine deaminase RidA (YjgF/YER057c/UK114 family)